PVDVAEKMLSLAYGFRPEWDREPTRRVEFSIHPRKRGVRHEHTVIWEIGALDDTWSAPPSPGRLQVGSWPNRFSRILGDKTYGLLLADALGFAVPRTTVVTSRIAPFTFGQRTGANGSWLRTAPAVNEPGRYPTCYYRAQNLPKGASNESPLQNLAHYMEDCVPLLSWTAFAVLQQLGFSPMWNPSEGAEIATVDLPAILAQQSVASEWSGSLITERTGPRIEGVRGFGDRFMMGEQKSEKLPRPVYAAVLGIQQQLQELLGPVSMEWAHDGAQVWLLQLNQELSLGSENILVPGDTDHWYEFKMSLGLGSLRELAEIAAKRGYGIVFSEPVAATSHAAAIVRKKGVPTRVRSDL